ncbi:hypothetical protein F4820DRAFT_327602 [Hypoxylon rubiginosum]|uniref:Uncharacterized protein n=1 Tax=Hypoxylon rubiginosum TaxID=110542 RepID=A0ACB9Z0C2_9PEZI|nr:hypothetical protein F4820DRAFT_327602 [Hypoxylon rubiginosum]
MTTQPLEETEHDQASPLIPTASQARGSIAREGDSDAAAAPRAKRVQVARACQRCRRLQKACSDSRPCQRCVKAGLADDCGGFPVPSRVLPPQPSLSLHALRFGEQLPSSPAGASFTASSSPPPSFRNPDLPASPQAFTSFARESFVRKDGLLPPRVVDRCAGRFFERLAPTIPILTPGYVAGLRARAALEASGGEAYCVLLGLCAMVMLQVEEPGASSFGGRLAESNAAYGWLLLEEALAAHRHLTRKSTPSLDSVLLVFFIYACHASLFHHSPAFVFLREASTLFLLLKPEAMDDLERELAERLFWVLLVSERSHAIRYRRPITLQVITTNGFGTASFSSGGGGGGENDPSLAGFKCLAALFRSLDTTFVALLNQESVSRTLPLDSLDGVEVAINTALNYSCPDDLLPTQKANLRVTQLWLRIILWQLRLRLGHLSSSGQGQGQGQRGAGAKPSSRTYHYPLEVAKDLTLSTRDLPVHSIQVHGVGISEKLFDIACAVVNVLARVPVEMTKTAAEDDLKYLRGLILQLPGGATVYDALLVKHIQQTLPNMAAGLGV